MKFKRLFFYLSEVIHYKGKTYCTVLIYLFLMITPVLLAGCKSQVLPTAGPSSAQINQSVLPAGSVESFMSCDCLLPGKIRKLGRKTIYITPRRPLKTTAVDCEIRGGEYVAYDRADYTTALRVWLPQAEQGDKVAQTYVGEIYEKGLGTAPNYFLAEKWYRNAAEQGYARAQMNLGHLYEAGLGVAKNRKKAAGWYRKAAGLEDIPIIGEADEDESEQIKKLREELHRSERQIELLRQELTESEEKRRTSQESDSNVMQLRQRIDALQEKIIVLQRDRAEARPGLGTIPPVDYGRYYALVIGNNRYGHLPVLSTAVRDAEEVDRILRGKYGFRTKLITDATQYETISALFEFQKNLTKEDNFLIYYAGHGEYDSINARGHWLPVDAEKKNPAHWISNDKITDMLNTMQARHIIVIADSCYSGTMTGLSIPRLRPGMSEEVLIHSVKTIAKKRSRTVFTSGGLEPVSDTGGGGHSIFAVVLLDLLENNKQVFTGKDLHDDVSPRVSLRSLDALGKKQEPAYAAFRYAGHEGGDFFFVPSKTLADSDDQSSGFLARTYPR